MRANVLITAGRGPDECHLVVTRLAAILRAEAGTVGLHVAVADTVPGAHRDAARSIVLAASGAGAPAWAASTAGPVRWTATSPLRPRHPRRNWFVQVAVLDGDDEAAAPTGIDEADVRFRAVRSGGPGGQRRNKVATAVRAEHLPSGRIVVASGERTLAANRAAVLARLTELAVAQHDEQRSRQAERRWSQHDQLVRGNPVRTVRRPLR